MATNIRIKSLNRKSFTLIELLVVLALVAILSVVVVMTLNPAELIKQARDSNRLSDLATINTALNLFSADVTSGFMGTSTVVYVSIPDNASSTCGSLGLPALPTGYNYNCVSTANLRNTNGTGWIPVNFQRISSNSPISQLPIDPQNTTSTKYYTYVTGGSWQLATKMESSKYQATAYASGGADPSTYTIGNNLSLAPFVGGLVGWWSFEEAGTSTVFDGSGFGRSGIMYSSTTVADIHSGSGCKVGSGCGVFDGIDDFVNTPGTAMDTLATTGDFSVSGWAKTTSTLFAIIAQGYGAHGGGRWLSGSNSSKPYVSLYGGASSPSYKTAMGTTFVQDNNWNNITSVYSRSEASMRLYLNGNLEASIPWDGYVELMQAGQVNIGKLQYRDSNGMYLMRGYIDDVRVYKKTLSAAEVLAIYNAGK